jgi:hypothetical protein
MEWAVVVGASVLSILISTFKLHKKINRVASEITDLARTISTATSPDSDSGVKISKDELVKIVSELKGVIDAFKTPENEKK